MGRSGREVVCYMQDHRTVAVSLESKEGEEAPLVKEGIPKLLVVVPYGKRTRRR